MSALTRFGYISFDDTDAQISNLSNQITVIGSNFASHVAANEDVHGTDGEVVGVDNVQTLTNKTLTTPIIKNGSITLALPTTFGNDSFVATTSSDILHNKSLIDTSTSIVDLTDNTKQIKFNAAGTTNTSTTLLSSQTSNRIITLPDANDVLVGKDTNDIFTNKTINASNNTITNINHTSLLNIGTNTHAQIDSNLSTLNGYVNQDVRTTSSPTFVQVKTDDIIANIGTRPNFSGGLNTDAIRPYTPAGKVSFLNGISTGVIAGLSGQVVFNDHIETPGLYITSGISEDTTQTKYLQINTSTGLVSYTTGRSIFSESYTTTDNGTYGICHYQTSSNKSYLIETLWTAYCSSGDQVGKIFTGRLLQSYKNVSGTVSGVSTLQNNSTLETGLSGAAINILIDGTQLYSQIQGISSNTLQWIVQFNVLTQ